MNDSRILATLKLQQKESSDVVERLSENNSRFRNKHLITVLLSKTNTI